MSFSFPDSLEDTESMIGMDVFYKHFSDWIAAKVISTGVYGRIGWEPYTCALTLPEDKSLERNDAGNAAYFIHKFGEADTSKFKGCFNFHIATETLFRKVWPIDSTIDLADDADRVGKDVFVKYFHEERYAAGRIIAFDDKRGYIAYCPKESALAMGLSTNGFPNISRGMVIAGKAGHFILGTGSESKDPQRSEFKFAIDGRHTV